MRLIDADELMEYVWRCRLDSRERIADLVKSMPTIEQRKKGKWIIISDGWFDVVRCDQCGKTQDDISSYCPHCGADMRGVQE